MPYITPEIKSLIDTGRIPQTSGELNYKITTLLLSYLKYQCTSYKFKGKKLQWNYKYQLLNDILGALEGAKLEFYRRVAVPYEKKKCKENGDVY